MKTIGLIGGISWVSTLEYYKLINEGINKQLGGSNFARLIIHSLNFADVKRNQQNNNPRANYEMVESACKNMKAGGAQAIVLCANTMHMMAEELEAAIGLPLIHIAKASAETIVAAHIKKVGLLGTQFTMEMDFFKDKLKAKNIECLIPDKEDREYIHQSIANELGLGIFSDSTRERYKTIIHKLEAQGCEGIILGCTEIPLLIKQSDCNAIIFDTTLIHSNAAVQFMCG